MAGNNITRKLRFLPFLPYGFCSKTATTMKGRYNPYARQLFLGEDPTELYHLANNNRSTHHNGATPPNFFIPVKVGREGWRRTELRRTHVKNE